MPKATSFNQNASPEIQEMRNACTSFATAKGSAADRHAMAVNAGILDHVPALGSNTSRGATIIRMFSMLTWQAVINMEAKVPSKIAGALVAVGCTLPSDRVIMVPNEQGNPWLPKPVRDALAQLGALGVHPVHYAVEVDLDDLGYSGLQALAVIIGSTHELDALIGFEHDWSPEQIVGMADAKSQDACKVDVPEGISMGGVATSGVDCAALHRLAIAYVGRAAFTRPGALNPFRREATPMALRQHFTKGSASWCRIMTGDRGRHSIPGDAAANLQLRVRAGRVSGVTIPTQD